MDYTPLIEKRRQRLEELETVIAEPDFFNDQKRASETMREHRRLKELMETWDSLSHGTAIGGQSGAGEDG